MKAWAAAAVYTKAAPVTVAFMNKTANERRPDCRIPRPAKNDMKNASRPLSLLLLALWLLSSLPAHGAASAQKREHLTPEEVELIRNAQKLDQRTGVFIKAAERRLALLADPASKESDKDVEKWGELKGTRRQLFDDVYRIFDEAVVNIDDTAQRDPKSALLARSLSKLAAAARRLLPQLSPLRASAQNNVEREALEEVIEKAEEIIEAAKRHDVDAVVEQEKSGKKGEKDN